MEKKWWHNSVVYQVYPKSFKDSKGNGSGDICGVIEKLGYLKDLGIDIIWMSPVYESPMDDNGYDISHYTEIAPEFGTMQDMEKLLAEAKKREIKIIMDLVVNHTSDEHPWFVEARQSKDNPYRDFYVWRKPVDGKEPSKAQSFFGGSAWEWDEITKEYYLHLFSKKQPDLNWENPTLRKKIYEIMNFWINKGVGGFRMDVIELIGKDIDNLVLGNTDKTHQYLQEMNQATFGNKDLFTVGETGGATIERAKLFSNPVRGELNTIFQFQHIALDEVRGKSKWDLRPLDLIELKEVMTKWQTELKDEGWNSLFWSNHDQPRIVSRWGDDKKYRVESAKMLATLLHFMKGTPYVYQGEEIGMTNAYFTCLEDYKDIETLNLYKERIELGYSHEQIMTSLLTKSRDNARTPMQWDDSKQAGFTTGEPWIKVNENYEVVNVKEALQDSDSIYYYYKKLITLRKQYELIVYGEYELILQDNPQIFTYIRSYKEQRFLVICNFYSEQAHFILPENINITKTELIISNYSTNIITIKNLILKPYEAIVVSI